MHRATAEAVSVTEDGGVKAHVIKAADHARNWFSMCKATAVAVSVSEDGGVKAYAIEAASRALK